MKTIHGLQCAALDKGVELQDNGSAANTNAVGLGGPDNFGGRPPSERFFYVRRMASSMGGPCGRAQALPVPKYRSANLHGSAHPSWRRGRGLANPLLWRPPCLHSPWRIRALLLARSGLSPSLFAPPANRWHLRPLPAAVAMLSSMPCPRPASSRRLPPASNRSARRPMRCAYSRRNAVWPISLNA